ncbi:hypothetical protein CYLTODRAFT_373907 [Cylindrobasidium torrendii FP15055 ss-10]|uniref:Mak10-domain-containing protein n=1 Tax=Cylindrobasidium torrendii FP15055 ss-10 TaxID=1314674 RepID=A0A0D7BE98_9AGAR|nr:hypothetical protein CYLTODRAFT_373907 [Cylindrobasidium torrendii FP15055 ss-10]
MDLPGGDDFQDVRDIFSAASAEMQPGETVWMDGFTLLEAMSALEIGEPRLDSGMVSSSVPPFDALAPLLPEEICWIIDRACAYEMEWHAGNLLSTTVFTLVYIHELGQIDPDMVSHRHSGSQDPRRPIELISVILQTYIIGLLKCCGAVWDKLNRSSLHDSEDWQSDKCEVSLLEGYQTKAALAKLDDTLAWLSTTSKIAPSWKEQLAARLYLRKSMLLLMNTSAFDHPQTFQATLSQARVALAYVRQHSAPAPSRDSPAHLAFDPYIGRRLVTFIPIRVLELPPVEHSWDAIQRLLDGWQEMATLAYSHSLTAWETAGLTRTWLGVERPAYVRASTQAIFYNGLIVLGKYGSAWVTQSFFNETVGIAQAHVYRIIQDSWTAKTPVPLSQIERLMSKTVIPTILAAWDNGPRRRRILANLASEWHALYDLFLRIASNTHPSTAADIRIMTKLPKAVLIWRMNILQEIVLSGFQLELYAANERPFAYWYTAQLVEQQLLAIDTVEALVNPISSLARELAFRRSFMTAIQHLCIGMYLTLAPCIPFDWPTYKHTFMRRFKWVFRPDYQDVLARPVGHPELFKFMPERDAVMQDSRASPRASCAIALEILTKIVEGSGARRPFVEKLIATAENLCTHLPELVDEQFDWKQNSKWDVNVDPWFPAVSL